MLSCYQNKKGDLLLLFIYWFVCLLIFVLFLFLFLLSTIGREGICFIFVFVFAQIKLVGKVYVKFQILKSIELYQYWKNWQYFGPSVSAESLSSFLKTRITKKKNPNTKVTIYVIRLDKTLLDHCLKIWHNTVKHIWTYLLLLENIHNFVCKIVRNLCKIVHKLQGFFTGGVPSQLAKIWSIPPIWHSSPFSDQSLSPSTRHLSPKILKILVHFCIDFDYF